MRYADKANTQVLPINKATELGSLYTGGGSVYKLDDQ
jgi:hypothetical protein